MYLSVTNIGFYIISFLIVSHQDLLPTVFTKYLTMHWHQLTSVRIIICQQFFNPRLQNKINNKALSVRVIVICSGHKHLWRDSYKGVGHASTLLESILHKIIIIIIMVQSPTHHEWWWWMAPDWELRSKVVGWIPRHASNFPSMIGKNST